MYEMQAELQRSGASTASGSLVCLHAMHGATCVERRRGKVPSKASEQAELRYLRSSQFLTGTELFLLALSKARGSRSEP